MRLSDVIPDYQIGDVVQIKGKPRTSADTILYYVNEVHWDRVGKIIAIHEDNGGIDRRYQIEFTSDRKTWWFSSGHIAKKLDV